MICPKFHPKKLCPKFHPYFSLGQISVAQGPAAVGRTPNRKNSPVFYNIYSGHVLLTTEFQSNEARGSQ